MHTIPTNSNFFANLFAGTLLRIGEIRFDMLCFTFNLPVAFLNVRSLLSFDEWHVKVSTQISSYKSSMAEPKVIKHPLVASHLTVLRDKSTRPQAFRQSVNRLSSLLAYAATDDLVTTDLPIETPLQKMIGQRLLDRIGLVPILRAGVGMVDPMLAMIPNSEVWHLGFYRDEATAQPVHYYSKLPAKSTVDIAFVLDPMLATGGSASMACRALTDWGVPRIKMLSIIAAPEGVERLQTDFPDVEILTCVIDEGLNEDKFIVPGLGDAGDRIFNTTG